jgi:hypothetical protein
VQCRETADITGHLLANEALPLHPTVQIEELCDDAREVLRPARPNHVEHLLGGKVELPESAVCHDHLQQFPCDEPLRRNPNASFPPELKPMQLADDREFWMGVADPAEQRRP